MKETGLETIYRYMPPAVRDALQKMPVDKQKTVQEIRLRAVRPVALSFWNRESFLTSSGGLTNCPAQAIVVSQNQLAETFSAVCEYSVYRYTHEICDGFITVYGGNRVGIAGSAVYKDGRLSQIRHISGLNFRISHAAVGCAEPLYHQVFSFAPCGVLIAGAVGSGKTTMLRDFCRLAGDTYRIALVDERSEIAAMYQGAPKYDVGLHTDVLDGFPRAAGLLTALRVLTPEAIFCDEIGTEEDAAAILRIHGCGVPIVASAHGTSQQELKQRSVLQKLWSVGVFTYTVILSDRTDEFQILGQQTSG